MVRKSNVEIVQSVLAQWPGEGCSEAFIAKESGLTCDQVSRAVDLLSAAGFVTASVRRKFSRTVTLIKDVSAAETSETVEDLGDDVTDLGIDRCDNLQCGCQEDEDEPVSRPVDMMEFLFGPRPTWQQNAQALKARITALETELATCRDRLGELLINHYDELL